MEKMGLDCCSSFDKKLRMASTKSRHIGYVDILVESNMRIDSSSFTLSGKSNRLFKLFHKKISFHHLTSFLRHNSKIARKSVTATSGDSNSWGPLVHVTSG